MWTCCKIPIQENIQDLSLKLKFIYHRITLVCYYLLCLCAGAQSLLLLLSLIAYEELILNEFEREFKLRNLKFYAIILIW